MKACRMQLPCNMVIEKPVEKLHVVAGIVVTVHVQRSLAQIAKQRLSFRSNASCPKTLNMIQFINALLYTYPI
jgi:hypothetical protein